jgi:hypothetical protein
MAMRLAPVSSQSPAASASIRARGMLGRALKSKVARVLSAWQARLFEVALDPSGIALGEFDVGEHGKKPGGRPAFGIRTFGKLLPVAQEARQAQCGEHGRQRMHVDRLVCDRGAHACPSSRSSKLASPVRLTGMSSGNSRRIGASFCLRFHASGR